MLDLQPEPVTRSRGERQRVVRGVAEVHTGDGDLAFDPTGLVKGWAVDRASVPLSGLEGISFCINAGGDLLIGAHPDLPTDGPRAITWRVGVEDPLDRQRIASTLTLTRGAVATSGTAARGAHRQRCGSRAAASVFRSARPRPT